MVKDQVHRPDVVTINLPEYERQRAEEAAYRRYLKELDPAWLGIYGSTDGDED